MTTMTREEAVTIVTSIVREHSRECREPKPCQDCELEAEAIAALSQPEPLSPWLPIESAPRDGTERGPGRPVLLYVGGAVVSAQHYANDCWVTEYSCTEHVYAPEFWRELLPAPPALHQLGAKVEVSDG